MTSLLLPGKTSITKKKKILWRKLSWIASFAPNMEKSTPKTVLRKPSMEDTNCKICETYLPPKIPNYPQAKLIALQRSQTTLRRNVSPSKDPKLPSGETYLPPKIPNYPQAKLISLQRSQTTLRRNLSPSKDPKLPSGETYLPLKIPNYPQAKHISL